ncbi:metallophosphoesterase family protein [Sphingomonas glacialis]|uniref:Serine/threonine protein phosphatase n=1 Tax=Sphingomonas glacialis TaxID=658225 RepID=A0A502G064_9SPHN|nr:metallophosphoesterase family protein [Sphingomonas glacialis]TPG55164.1 serine/threonine protein phosphatase [Sphingomonas glacialis]
MSSASPLPRASPPSGPPESRAYAIGDVHGRLDLLDALLEQIADDRRHQPCPREFLVFLGDMIDRGPDSKGVVERLRGLDDPTLHPVFLMGNHEEMLVRALGTQPQRLRDWLTFGGAEYVESYGVDPARVAELDPASAAAVIRAAIPRGDLAFIDGFADSFRFGDYLFVHAGIRPGVALDQQRTGDLRWIREDFLGSQVDHPLFVIHGHTISDGPDECANRIGIDTGAYASNVLTALCIEGTRRRYLATAA